MEVYVLQGGDIKTIIYKNGKLQILILKIDWCIETVWNVLTTYFLSCSYWKIGLPRYGLVKYAQIRWLSKINHSSNKSL